MKDILLSQEYDLKFSSGDFLTGEAEKQHSELLLLLQKGSLKSLPLVGVGIQDYLNSTDISGMLREVRHQFGSDGMVVNAVSWDDEKQILDYDAKYQD